MKDENCGNSVRLTEKEIQNVKLVRTTGKMGEVIETDSLFSLVECNSCGDQGIVLTVKNCDYRDFNIQFDKKSFLQAADKIRNHGKNPGRR